MVALIEIRDVTFHYKTQPKYSKPALSAVNLQIEQGEFVAIIGANGSGKSTLGKLLNALLIPDKGSVYINGMDSRNPQNYASIRTQVGMVFQKPQNQIVATTVEEDIAFGPGNLGLAPNEIRKRVNYALSECRMGEFRNRSSYLLSAGEMQRLALAGVLAMQPDCIIFDETTAMLDPAGREMVMTQARTLHHQGKTILFITHIMEEAAKADRLIVLEHGKIVMDGTSQQVFSENIKTIGLEKPSPLVAANQLRRYIPELPEGILTEANLFKHVPVYRGKWYDKPPLSEQKTVNACIEGANLSYAYMQNTPLEQLALENVSIKIGSGQTHGLIGATGSGKSTLLQHFNGLLRPQHGILYVLGMAITSDKFDTSSLRKRVGLAFQQPENQIFNQYVGDEIAYGARQLGSDKRIEIAVKDAMHAVGLDFNAFKDRLAMTLSGGEMRKVALASAVVTNPEILLLDEPLAGLDPFSRNEIMGYFKEMHNNRKTLVFSTHQYENVISEMDIVSVLESGKDITHGKPGNVFSHLGDKVPPALKAPFAVRLGNALKEKGWPVPMGTLRLEDVVNAVAKICRGSAG